MIRPLRRRMARGGRRRRTPQLSRLPSIDRSERFAERLPPDWRPGLFESRRASVAITPALARGRPHTGTKFELRPSNLWPETANLFFATVAAMRLVDAIGN